MKKTFGKKQVLIVLFCVFSIGAVSALLKAGSYVAQKDTYIEVGGGRIAYVPRTTEYVKFNGQIRKIVKFASTLSKEEKDCECPNCCKGYCYVIIFSEAGAVRNPIIILSIIWLAC